MILVEDTIFDEFAQRAKYNFEMFLEKVRGYAENAIGITPESKHPFWSDLDAWLEENRDLFDDLAEKAA